METKTDMNQYETILHKEHDSIQMSFHEIQFRLAIFVFTFWSLVVFFLINKYEINRFRPIFFETITNKILNNPRIQRISDLKDTIKEILFHFDIRRIQTVIHSTRSFLSTIKQTLLTTRPKYNLSLFISYIKSFLLNFHNISKSFSAVGKRVLDGVKMLLLIPIRTKMNLQGAMNEIKNFKKIIEQIVQIIRLPIEAMRTIGSLAINIAAFLNRLQKPKLHIR